MTFSSVKKSYSTTPARNDTLNLNLEDWTEPYYAQNSLRKIWKNVSEFRCFNHESNQYQIKPLNSEK